MYVCGYEAQTLRDVTIFDCLVFRYLSCFNEHLSVLLSSTTTLQVVACGVTLTHLLAAKDQLERRAASSKEVDDMCQYLESLDLSFNLLLSHVGEAASDSDSEIVGERNRWAELCSWLACHCRRLQCVNLSYCSGV